ncbi:MAG: hypothetical protein WBK76_04045 [Candidatus Saccharimonadales bacterium]|jgi:hypothetical protein
MTNIYLDIDGVLLDKGSASYGATKFIKYVTSNFPDSTYWLTTRCSGDAEATVNQIKQYFDADTVSHLSTIKPTSWPIVKTQAIDLSQPFLWFDDTLGWADKQKLEENNVLDNLILIDLTKNPAQLAQLVNDFPLPADFARHV